MNEVTNKESHLRNNKELCFGGIDSKGIVGSHWRSNERSVESSSTPRIVKPSRTRQILSKESSNDRNESVKTKNELMSKQEKTTSLKTPNQKQKGKCTMENLGGLNVQTRLQTMKRCDTNLSIMSHLRTQ